MENNEVVQEAISKDFQIKFLEEKLAFMQKQLDEKDVQLDHYKSLLRAMQEVLNKQASPSRETKPPPGFEKNSISKARKMHSFHVDPSAHHLEEEDIQYSHVIVEDFEEYEKDMARRQQIESELVQRSPGSLKKSRSHTSFAHLRVADSPPMSASTSSLPNLPSKKSPSSPYVGLSPVREDESWKSSKLKKSQSMTSMYSALDENRLDFKFPDLSQMVGQIYQLSRYQQGCRFLQKKLEEDPKNATTILKELSDHLVELMTDPFGNYLFTKLVEHCDMEQRGQLLQKILPDISQVAFDMYGTQSLQKMMQLGTLAEGQIEQIVEVLKPQALALIKHNKANYLIQYCLDRLPEQYNKWIYDSVAQHMEEISRDRVGCVIVKRCIDHATENQMGQLHATIQKVALRLVQDPFGNYVAQHVLQKFPGTEQANKLAATLVGSITELCIQKFSSNVVEKCLKVADEETKKAMLKEITESEMLPQLLNDRFANFVIQTALDVADQEQRAELVKNILPHLGKHYSPYTKRLQKKILQV